MRLSLFITICLILFPCFTHGQSFEWVNKNNSTSDTLVTLYNYSVAVDKNENVYVAGSFSGTADFAPGPSSHILNSMGGFDVFVQKFKANGELVWLRQISGLSSDDEVMNSSISVDYEGNLLLNGSFSLNADFDPGPDTALLNSEEGTVYVLKLDTDGNYLWAARMGLRDCLCDFSKIVTDSSNNIIIGGHFSGITDFDPSSNEFVRDSKTNARTDLFIEKLDKNGNFKWAKSIGGDGFDYLKGIAVDSSQNIVFIGDFEWSIDAYPNNDTVTFYGPGGHNLFMGKLDADGTLIWVKQISGVNENSIRSVSCDYNNIIITGGFQDSADFGFGATTKFLKSSNGSTFIAKLDMGGTLQWVKQLYANTTCVSSDKHGSIYVSGSFSNKSDFAPIADTSSMEFVTDRGSDGYVLKLNQFGEYQWVKQVAGKGEDQILSMCISLNGDVLMNGSFNDSLSLSLINGEVTIAPSTFHAFFDYYTLKLTQEKNAVTHRNNSPNNISLFPNPTQGKFSIIVDSLRNITRITLRNSIGQQFSFDLEFNYAKCDVDISTYPTGLYFIEIETSDKQTFVSPVVKF
jgi:hypothetical protein